MFSSHTAEENCLFKQIIWNPIQNQSFCTLVVSKLKIYISQKGDNYRFLLQNLHKSKLVGHKFETFVLIQNIHFLLIRVSVKLWKLTSLSSIPYTKRNILEDSSYLVKYFPEILLWEYRFASFNKKNPFNQKMQFCTPR